jgi:hypothetical protein
MLRRSGSGRLYARIFTFPEMMMKKKRMAIFIAAALFGAQIGIAAEELDTVPGASAEQSVMPEMTSLQTAEAVAADSTPQVLAESPAADTPKPSAMHISAIPPGADDLAAKSLPALERYLDERAARTQYALRGDVFPQGADDLASKPLPALARYFDQKEANANVASYKEPAARSIE